MCKCYQRFLYEFKLRKAKLFQRLHYIYFQRKLKMLLKCANTKYATNASSKNSCGYNLRSSFITHVIMPQR